MVQKQLTIFDVKSMDEERTKEFYNFFSRYNLMPLFTNEHLAGTISVSDLELRALTNEGGAYNKRDFKKLADYLAMANDNKTYEEAVFSIINNVKGFQGLVNNIKKLVKFIESEIQAEHSHNMWNIVTYSEKLR